MDPPANSTAAPAARSIGPSRAPPAIRIVVAGGLDAANVAEAIAIARPWGVDACSRIEARPGKRTTPKCKHSFKPRFKRPLQATPEALAL